MKKCSFTELVAALFAWTERNPIETKPRERQPEFPNKLRDTSSNAFHGQTRQVEHKYRGCVYCEVKNHKSFACDSLKTSDERRRKNSATIALVQSIEIQSTTASKRVRTVVEGITLLSVIRRRNQRRCWQRVIQMTTK